MVAKGIEWLRRKNNDGHIQDPLLQYASAKYELDWNPEETSSEVQNMDISSPADGHVSNNLFFILTDVRRNTPEEMSWYIIKHTIA